MIVLGVKAGEHDACFALIEDGEPVFVYEQERFNRVKNGMSSDLTVLFEGLAEHGISPGEIDLVANCGDPGLIPERLRQTRGYLSGPAFARAAENVKWRHPTFHRVMAAAGFAEERIEDVRHHLCHAASVFYASPFDDAAVLSIDCSGEADTAMLAHCSRRDGIKILETIGLPHSLGRFYESVTRWLGWGFGEEGKTMALAAYGEPQRYLADLSGFFRIADDGFFEFDPGLTDGTFSYSTEELVGRIFEESFGPRRERDDEIEQHHKDVAAAVQYMCEQVMVRLATTLKKRTGSNALLLAGGVASNSVANGAIRNAELFERVVVYPQVTDAGTALGTALYTYHRKQAGSHGHWEMRHPYLGRQIDLARVHEAAAAVGIEGFQCDDPAAFAAERLAAGQIVGWIQGRSEIGPRALGNRSILGNPLTRGIKTRINAEVKHRENWRPFAPSVLEDDQSLFFETAETLPYMTIVATIRAEWRERLTSISHVDGTARIGSVSESFNPLFYRLIKEFKKRSGIGMVLNTSFNDKGEPIVQTCEQALRLFGSSGMDALVIGDWVFTDKRNARVSDFDPLIVNCRRIPDKPTLLVALREADHAQRAIEVLLRKQAVGTLEIRTMGETETDLVEVATKWPQVAVLVPWSADKFIFDPTVYYSEIADTCRRLIEAGTYQLFWIDPRGQVVSARDVLYVHHRSQPSGVPAAYARYWQAPGS
ncbi:carbamoyltransferase [Saccharopolyspora spinosa]|uniref:Beta-1,4-N-acetylglucosamine oligosaccharide 3-O-carbamoyltransferase NolO n=1 Tax=Saccharopolyspora spinosa TaxID=60894 RepID=A0A2N3Y0Y2_SACSN|nr:carbamoyltransferase C-terminal domain-containing protein [Saccharopolyspora spinosa]PKW16543.1 beta-1,4-N-acetylglucosamine oligosaccharide 3-O-carbamoyltransferase NolO [Saccharopolyspora spinosa]